MAIRPLVQLNRDDFFSGTTNLRKPSSLVTEFGAETQAVIDDLVDTLHSDRIAVGLAAPQIGVALAIAVINLKKEGSEDLVLVNPRITSTSGKKSKMKESCMSLPHFRGEVIRRHRLEAQYRDREGTEHSTSAQGFLARVIAHEVDHLNGVLYVDRMEPGADLEPVEFFK